MNEKECSKCGGRELGTGKQAGYAKMASGRFNLGSNILHTICINCGFIVESYVERPRNFKDKN